MSTRPVLLQRKRVEDALHTVSPRHAFLFAAACAERQWPVYERASAGKPWAMQAVLRSSLDAVWDWLSGRAERPRLAEQCERAVFDENSDDEAANGAVSAATSFYGLASIVPEDPPKYTPRSA